MDACFRIWVWFVPILFAGIMILRICIRQWKSKSPWRWVSSVLLVGFTYGSDAYPEIEITNIRYGFTEVNYLDNNFALALTSRMLEEHQDVFMVSPDGSLS